MKYYAAILYCRVIAMLLSCFCCYYASAQSIPYKLYTIHDGIPQSQILKIFQDSRGYMWIGTYDGMAYFDGSKFTNITVHQDLPSRTIYHITEDDQKNILFNVFG